jgi:hypothetical protein
MLTEYLELATSGWAAPGSAAFAGELTVIPELTTGFAWLWTTTAREEIARRSMAVKNVFTALVLMTGFGALGGEAPTEAGTFVTAGPTW